jgi:NADH-quinone oxidoreductase subunit J
VAGADFIWCCSFIHFTRSWIFAVAQVLIYIGAIAILFIFAVMLTRRIMADPGPRFNSLWWVAALVAVLLFSGVAFMLSQSSIFPAQASDVVSQDQLLVDLGQILVSPTGYLLPFELASVLLVAAMIGAIYAAYVKK